MKNTLKVLIRRFFGTSVASELLKWNYSCIKKLNPRIVEVDESNAEQFFTRSRRILFQTPSWRYGPDRVKEVSKEAFDGFQGFGSIIGKTYLDLGSGAKHPYGTSAIMFLNGASRTAALDVTQPDERRAAEALCDLIADCAADPDNWRFSGISRQDFLNNIYRFNAPALRSGNLKMGIAGTPMEHIIADIDTNSIDSDSIDFMSSRAVLEHFLDFPRALSELRRVMSPGGIAYHHIDLVDHRYYGDPRKYHYWSFLAEDDEWSDGVCNRLRFSELRKYIEDADFEILRFEGRRDRMPTDFRKHLRGRFKRMSDEELNITGVSCVLREPQSKEHA